MISIQNNMLAMNAERHFQINGKKNAKITEKLWVEIDRIDQSTEFNEQPIRSPAYSRSHCYCY